MQLDGNVSAKQSIQGTLRKINTIHINTYQIAVQNGFEGTVEEWLASLKGEKGDKGDTPVLGTDYFTESDKEQIVSDVLSALPVYDGSVTSV